MTTYDLVIYLEDDHGVQLIAHHEGQPYGTLFDAEVAGRRYAATTQSVLGGHCFCQVRNTRTWQVLGVVYASGEMYTNLAGYVRGWTHITC